MKEPKLDGMELTGYYPGVVGKITEIHATYYYENWGFDVSFETQVGRELSEFIMDFEENRDGFWVAKINGEFAGAVAIDGSGADKGEARLRWFIVPPKFQRRGVGGILIKRAIDFCKKANIRRVYLWTFEGLDEARSLYEREGFRLSQEHDVYQWGQEIKEQKFLIYL
ncbi:MAG: GNAT family N-acetyltransferase [Desulfobacteraceae bacterium]|jgi:GNAT superfamily N-acetyltransferase